MSLSVSVCVCASLLYRMITGDDRSLRRHGGLLNPNPINLVENDTIMKTIGTVHPFTSSLAATGFKSPHNYSPTAREKYHSDTMHHLRFSLL